MIFPGVNNGGILTYHHVYLSVEVWFILVRFSWYVCSLSRQLLGTLANNNCPAGAPRMAHVYILGKKKKKKNRLHRLVKNLFKRRSPCIISYSRCHLYKIPIKLILGVRFITNIKRKSIYSNVISYCPMKFQRLFSRLEHLQLLIKEL
jgi:hypothetical protein